MDSLTRFNKQMPRWQWRNDRECTFCDNGRVGGERLDVDDFAPDYACPDCGGTGVRYECEPDVLQLLRFIRLDRNRVESDYRLGRRIAYKPSDNWIEYSVAETFAMTPKPKVIGLDALFNHLFRSAA